MTDPTDYRAEAEKWYAIATEDDFVDVPDMNDFVDVPDMNDVIDVPDMNDVIASALIGILAALLAGLPAAVETRWGPEVVLTKQQSDAIHAILNSPSEG